MHEREIQIHREQSEMTTFIAHPDSGGPFPVAVLYMDGIGYREQVKENARRFAADGFYCVAPDLFYHAGKGVTVDMTKMMSAGGMQSEEGRRLMEMVRSVTPARVVEDTRAILAEIASDSAAAAGPKVCVGYCMGARLALHMASAMPDEFVAAAGIHPGALVTDNADSPHHELGAVRGELYFAFAEQDRTATPESIDEFRRAMESNGVRGVVERLPGTAHGFAMADLPVYNRDAAERHFERTLELWRRNLQPAPATA
jgi:carboxymethylenebutenolidase